MVQELFLLSGECRQTLLTVYAVGGVVFHGTRWLQFCSVAMAFDKPVYSYETTGLLSVINRLLIQRKPEYVFITSWSRFGDPTRRRVGPRVMSFALPWLCGVGLMARPAGHSGAYCSNASSIFCFNGSITPKPVCS